MTTIAYLFVGALAGCGVLLVVRGVVPDVPSLPSLLDDLHRPRRATDRADARPWVEAVAGRADRPLVTDLAVCERSLDRFATDRLVWAAVFALVPAAIGVLGLVVGPLGLPPGTALAAAAPAAIGGWWYARVDLRRDAERARRDVRHAVGAYLELVTILIAGGRGVESALHDAAEMGEGLPFRQLRRALAAAEARREPPWQALGRLGRELRITVLEEIESSMTLAGESGARVRQSLAAKAEALRIRDLGEIEAEAQSRSETMVFPIAAMFLAFVVLIGFPALQALSGV